jgi:predicted metal-dependent phosphotriesterase family hydrolase
VIIPALQDAGVSADSVHRMLVTNPARILAIP